jgi:O-antigen/teichoic acid export membrane protein
MEIEPSAKTKNSLILQTVGLIGFIALCTFIIMKMINKESDALSIFLIGFGAFFAIIVLLASYIKYVVNIYFQIKNARKNRSIIKSKAEDNEKNHMKLVHSRNYKMQSKNKIKH